MMSSEDWSKQRSIMQQRIDLLNQQINEFKKRQQDTKKLNDTLLAALKELNNEQSRIHEAELLIINEELRVQLKHMTRRHEEVVGYYQGQLQGLKEELRDARREVSAREVELERVKGVWENRVKNMQVEMEDRERELRRLGLELQESNALRERLQADLEDMRDRLATNEQLTKRRDYQQLRTSQLEPKGRGNSFEYMKTSTGQSQSEPQQSNPSNQNNMNASNISKLDRRKQRVQQFMKMDKNQFKMMVSTLQRVKQNLEQGEQNVTRLQDRSTIRHSFTNSQQQQQQYPNRTFYK